MDDIAYQNKKHTFNWLKLLVYAQFLDRSLSAYKIAVPIRFLDSLKISVHLYCVGQIPIFNTINTIVTDLYCNISNYYINILL